MTRSVRFLDLALAAILASGTARATDWYVDAAATPPGNGTVGSPYASIQYAHDQPSTVDFDTLLAAPGAYVENVTLTKRITVRATGGADVTTLMPAVAGPIVRLSGSGQHTSLTVEGFTITGVFGPNGTGAVQSFTGQLLRCIVRGNQGSNYRGVETAFDTYLVDCTVADNDVGVECNTLSEAIWMKNCVVWGNGTNVLTFIQPIGVDITYCAGGPFTFSSSPTNITGDPGLCNVASGDYHLRASSPCIDAGDPALPSDPDGSRSDIGYYAFDPALGCEPFETQCAGDGSGAACPCGNTGALGRGCQNSASTGGALLYADGTTSPDTVVLHARFELSTALTIFLQGNAVAIPSVPFGDGLRCAGGILKRLYVKVATNGIATAPEPGDLPITAQSAALGDPIPPGERRYYQAYFRDADATFCPAPAGSTFNASNAIKVIW